MGRHQVFALTWTALALIPGLLSAQRETTFPETPDVPELIIPEELRIEADRLEAEESAARAAREDAEDATELDRELIPVPRFETRARRLSDLHRDERSIERLRVDCRSDIERRDITLFANGTVRLKHGPWENQEMLLEELGPEELTVYLKKLVRIRRNDEFPEVEQGAAQRDLDGAWLRSCRVTVETPNDPPVFLVFNPIEMQPLPIGQLMQLAEELARFTRPLVAPDRLPLGYRPQVEDVLRGRDGVLYRVISPTDDGEGVELESLSEPLTVYYRIADLPDIFARLEVADESDAGERLLAEPAIYDLEDREKGFSARGLRVEPWDREATPPERSEELVEEFVPEDEPSSTGGVEPSSTGGVEPSSTGSGFRGP